MALQKDLDTLEGIKSQIQSSAEKSIGLALTMAWVSGIVLLITLALSLNQPAPLRLARLVTGLGIGLAGLIGLWLLKRRGGKAAIGFFSLCCYVAVTALSVRAGTGVASPGTPVVLTLVLIAGFIISPRVGKWYATGALAGVVALTGAQVMGWISGLTPENMPPAATYAVAYVILFAVAGATVHRFSILFWQVIAHLDQTRQALQSKVQQQQQTEGKLKDSEKRLTALLDNTPMAILIFEIEDGRLHYANQHALREHQVQDVLELDTKVLCSSAPYSRADLIQAVQRTFEHGPHEQQWRTANKQGQELWWSVKTDRLTLGDVTYVAAFAENITDQITVHQALIDEQFRLEEKVKERTNELLEQQRQLNAIIDALPVALSIKDLDGRYRMCNRVFEDIAGKGKAEILQHLDGEIFNFSTAYAIGYDDAQVLEEKQSKRSEQDIPTATGELKDYLVTKVPLMNERDEVQALLTMATDISDIKALQRDLRATSTEAERLAQIKAEFLANMSHEIRTPLNGVLGLAHIGAREHASNPSVQTLFQKITRSGQHLLGVINDILDFSKIDAGKLNIESNCLSPAQVAEEALSMLTERAQSKGLALTMVNQGVPSWIIGDSLRIQQILINLLSNAVKFTEQGHVTLTLAQHGDWLQFSVQDTGIGMTPQMLSRVFSPFEQADTSTTRQFGGTGLGLTISRQLARLMGGDIIVESRPGAGSLFTLTLPNQVSDPAPSMSPMNTALSLGDQPLLGVRVLAVDDVDVNREILISLLDSEGAQTYCAVHGLDALEQIKRRGADYFDVVLMDMQMPVMDGLTATVQIKAIAPSLPVIALTAHALPDERRRCLEAGMVSHLSKPIDPQLMVNAILEQTRRKPPAPAPAPEPPPALSSLKPLDGVDLNMALLRCGGKEKVLLKILTKFAQSQQEFIEQFHVLQKTDADQARRTAHALKGTAANLGFASISRLAANLEDACTHGTADEVAAALQQLGSQLPTTLSNLNDWLERQDESASIAYNGG